MNTQTDCFVSGSLAAALRISRLLGIAPLKFVKKKTGWRVSLCPWLNIYGYILVTILLASSVLMLIYDCNIVKASSIHCMRASTHYAVRVAAASIVLIIVAVSVYGAPAQMRAMISYLNRVQKINNELNVDCQSINAIKCEKKTGIISMFLLISTVVMTSADNYTSMMSAGSDVQNWLKFIHSFYYVGPWILQLRHVQTMLITLHVMYTFRAINDRLRDLLQDLRQYDRNRLFALENITENSIVSPRCESMNWSSGDVMSPSHHRATVRRLLLAYSSTCDVVRVVDARLGHILLLMLAFCLLHLVTSPYYLIINLFTSLNMESASKIMLQVFWCLYHSVILVVLTEPAHLTHSEMKITQELVSRLMHSTGSLNDPLSVELEQFFRHLVLNDVCYSPLRVTTMGRPLMATIFGSITTYLVVIIQI